MDHELKAQVGQELRQAIYPNKYGINTKVILRARNLSKGDIVVSSDLFTNTLVEIIQSIVKEHNLNYYIHSSLFQDKTKMEAVIYTVG